MSEFYPKISYTALERFERCQMEWRLRREGKRNQLDQKYVTDGNALHAALEAIVTGVPEDPVRHALSFWTMRVREENIRWTDQEKREHFERVGLGVHRLVELVDELEERGASHARMLTEVRMVHVGSGWAMEGFVDLMFEPRGEAKGYEIWDLKSGRWHHDQLVFYDLLGEQALGSRPDEVGIIEPFGRGLITQPIDESHRVDMHERIARMVVAIRAGQFPTTGYPDACSRCSSKPWCPRWEHARSGRLGA